MGVKLEKTVKNTPFLGVFTWFLRKFELKNDPYSKVWTGTQILMKKIPILGKFVYFGPKKAIDTGMNWSEKRQIFLKKLKKRAEKWVMSENKKRGSNNSRKQLEEKSRFLHLSVLLEPLMSQRVNYTCFSFITVLQAYTGVFLQKTCFFNPVFFAS